MNLAKRGLVLSMTIHTAHGNLMN